MNAASCNGSPNPRGMVDIFDPMNDRRLCFEDRTGLEAPSMLLAKTTMPSTSTKNACSSIEHMEGTDGRG